jgi:hypothetical protein
MANLKETSNFLYLTLILEIPSNIQEKFNKIGFG